LKKTKEGWKIIHHAWEGINKKMGNQLNRTIVGTMKLGNSN